jgi:hypothetical protein
MNEQIITREQAMEIILFKLPTLTDAEIRSVYGFINGTIKGRGK